MSGAAGNVYPETELARAIEKSEAAERTIIRVTSELAEHPERADVVVSTSVYGSEKLRGLRVLLVDDNDLTRHINETGGLEAGDQYLKNGYQILSEVFAHSPVYRIGGDEFTAVLQTLDYSNRDLLMGMLRDKSKDAKEKETIAEGFVSMAAGIAVYNPETDATPADVIRRAMSAMIKEE